MTRNPTRWLRRIVCIAVGCATILGAATAAAQGGKVAYVLTTSNVLYTIDTANPRTAIASVTITGVDANETLVGIDVRPRNGGLYGFAVDAATNETSLYYISPHTGVAARIGPANDGFFAPDFPDPAAARYGVDFDSKTDRLHVTSSYAGTDPASAGVNQFYDPNDGGWLPTNTAINPAGISIDEVAYTDNGLGHSGTPMVTSLYTISSVTISRSPRRG